MSTLLDLSKLEALDGGNYRRWSQKMLIFFEVLEVDYVLYNDAPSVDEDAVKKYDKDNKTVRGHMLNHMTNVLFDLFVNNRSAKLIWEALENKYGVDDVGKKKKKYVVGKWQLQFTIVDEDENLSPAVINEGMKMFDVLQPNVLLDEFPPSWSTDYRNQCFTKKNKFQNKYNYSINFGDKKITKPNYNCYVCGAPGHKAYRCNQRHKLPHQKSHKQPAAQNANHAIVTSVFEASLVENKSDWILVTGASRHVCRNRALFYQFEEAGDGECVYMATSGVAGVLGKGEIRLELTSGKTLSLSDVLFVPTMCRNMLSGALLNKAGLEIMCDPDGFVLTRNAEFVGKGYLNDGLFVLDVL